MKYSLCVLTILFTLFSCNSSQTDVPKTLEERSRLEAEEAKLLLLSTLEEKYNETFIIHEFYFEFGLNNYVFYAAPRSNKKIIFYGNFDEREDAPLDRIGLDAYPNMKFSYEASEFYKSLFPVKALEHVASASVYADYEHLWGSSVPSWDELLQNRGETTTINMNTYYFEIPDGPEHKIIKTQKLIFEELHRKYNNDFSMYVGFWSDGFLDGKKLEDLTFGFQSTSEKDADDILNVMQYLSKFLHLKVVTSNIEEMDEEGIFNSIKDDNKNGPNEITLL